VYFKSFSDHLSETCNCWKGYKRKPGTAPCAEGSCIKEGKRGLWDNIHAKQRRIKAGSGERMRTPGSEGAPTDAALKASQNEEVVTEAISKNDLISKLQKDLPKINDPKNKDAEPVKWTGPKKGDYGHTGYQGHGMPTDKAERDRIRADKKKSVTEELSADEQFDVIEEMVMAMAEEYNMDPELVWEKFEAVDDVTLYEAAVDAKGHKSSTGGLTQKGRDAYNAKGANLQAPVTTPPSKLKAGSKAANRRKSFCARMGGMEGPMKKPNGEPSRKALALRKWNC
jgi:hypothetical protein